MPWNRTIIYECHVKGMTMLHPDVPEKLRGTYLGLCSDPMIEYFHVARRHGASSCCRCTSSSSTGISPSAG